MYGIFGMSASVTTRSPRTASTSACSFMYASGFVSRQCTTKLSTPDVVSCPVTGVSPPATVVGWEDAYRR
jgi:hypothetical protein